MWNRTGRIAKGSNNRQANKRLIEQHYLSLVEEGLSGYTVDNKGVTKNYRFKLSKTERVGNELQWLDDDIDYQKIADITFYLFNL